MGSPRHVIPSLDQLQPNPASSTATRDLADLVAKAALTRTGQRKGTRYPPEPARDTRAGLRAWRQGRALCPRALIRVGRAGNAASSSIPALLECAPGLAGKQPTGQKIPRRLGHVNLSLKTFILTGR